MKVSTVFYPELCPGGRPLIAERVPYEDMVIPHRLETARSMQRLLRMSLTRQLVEEAGLVSGREVRRHVANESSVSKVTRYAMRMYDVSEHGIGRYWVARDPNNLGHFLAATATTTSGDGRCHVEVLASRDNQSHDGALLHAALTNSRFSGYFATNGITANAYDGTARADWLQQLGFQPENHMPPTIRTVGKHELAMRSYSASHVGRVIGNLVALDPRLGGAITSTYNP